MPDSMLIEALAYHDGTKYLVARPVSKTTNRKCAYKIVNPNNEVLHICKNFVVGTFEPISNN